MKTKTDSLSLWQIAWVQFLKHPLARVGLWILGLLYLMMIFAGFIAPYGLSEYTTDESRVSWAPPSQIHWVKDGKLTRPFIYTTKREVDFETFRDKYIEDTSKSYPIRFLVQRPEASYRLFGFIPSSWHLFGVDSPAKVFLWGSDNLGRDQFSRVMYGSQVSLTIGILAAFLSLTLGLFFGGIAGYFRGVIDTFVMRMVEVLSAIPSLFLLFTLRALFPAELNPMMVFVMVILLLSLVSWGGLARSIRSMLFSTRELDYVQAATSLGASDARIITKHMLPSTMTLIIIAMSLAIPGFILEESGLSFLGLGVVEPYSSWGSLLKVAQEGGFESISGRPWTLIPGFFIFISVLAWQFVGDGLRDAFDPRKRR